MERWDSPWQHEIGAPQDSLGATVCPFRRTASTLPGWVAPWGPLSLREYLQRHLLPSPGAPIKDSSLPLPYSPQTKPSPQKLPPSLPCFILKRDTSTKKQSRLERNQIQKEGWHWIVTMIITAFNLPQALELRSLKPLTKAMTPARVGKADGRS